MMELGSIIVSLCSLLLRREMAEKNNFTIHINLRAPRAFSSTPDNAFVPTSVVLGSFTIACILSFCAYTQILFATIQSSMVSVVHFNFIRCVHNHSMHQDFPTAFS